ncbi:cytochrome P450 [Daedalea quercina L-15889]|uniref:Cytochrome P450 n=1 Tax=Daedalea quercina L-15889 TaxID=1314783 RepID=A0A165QFA5_9APHY|nr:cytochrome P450 [Daedalea quercina L-15889]
MPITDDFAAVAGPYVATAICVYILLSLYPGETKRNGLPPGPKGVPFLGNIHQLPQIDQHITFTDWARQYGDIVYAEFFSKPTIILSSAKAAVDLMEKRGAKYSDRPPLFYFRELVGWTGNVGFAPYDDRWRRLRKWFQRGFIARSALDSYHPIQYREVRRLLRDLPQNTDNIVLELKRYTAAIMLEIGYGHTVTSLDDEYIKMIENGVRKCLSGSGAGSALVDFFPILKYVPAWIPGMGFKYSAAIARKAIEDMEDIPYNAVNNVATGDAKPSFTTRMIEDCSRDGRLTANDERDVRGAAGTLYAGKILSSLTSMLVFILVMVQHPEIFNKVQEEMTRVVGEARLPNFEDRVLLPYLECVIREVYRWCPSLPTSVPRQAMEDDVYRGYYIPKGSLVMANIWAMFRDPDVYPEPDVFKPERFLNVDGDADFDHKDPKKIIFGFGRRICPGRYFADDMIWLAAASIVATMDIRKVRNERGEEITPMPKSISGVVMRPEPFVCDIRLRSEKSLQLILDSSTNI